jgi:hypothetical protein
VRDRPAPGAHRRINLPAELSPHGGVSGFLHRLVESGDVPDAPRLIAGHSCPAAARPAVPPVARPCPRDNVVAEGREEHRSVSSCVSLTRSRVATPARHTPVAFGRTTERWWPSAPSPRHRAPLRPGRRGRGTAAPHRHRTTPECARAVQALPAPAWQEGCTNAATLFEQITDRGYAGGRQILRAYLRPFRASRPDRRLPVPPSKPPSVRCVVGWIMSDPANLEPANQHRLDAILAAGPEPSVVLSWVRVCRSETTPRKAVAPC